MWAIPTGASWLKKKKKKNQVKSPSPESRVPETGSDPLIGSGQDSGRDRNNQLLHLSKLLCFAYGSGFVQDFLNFGIGFLHIHWSETLASLEDKIKPATCISIPLARSGYFSFSILHAHFLMTTDLFAFHSQDFCKASTT